MPQGSQDEEGAAQQSLSQVGSSLWPHVCSPCPVTPSCLVRYDTDTVDGRQAADSFYVPRMLQHTFCLSRFVCLVQQVTLVGSSAVSHGSLITATSSDPPTSLPLFDVISKSSWLTAAPSVQALDLLAEVNSMAQQAQKLLVRRGQSNNATPRASVTPRDTPNGSRRQSMGAGHRRDSTAGPGEKDPGDAHPCEP